MPHENHIAKKTVAEELLVLQAILVLLVWLQAILVLLVCILNKLNLNALTLLIMSDLLSETKRWSIINTNLCILKILLHVKK
jgi:hypothetical protein